MYVSRSSLYDPKLFSPTRLRQGVWSKIKSNQIFSDSMAFLIVDRYPFWTTYHGPKNKEAKIQTPKNKVRTCIQSLPPSKIPFLCNFFPFLFPVLIRMHHKILKQQIFIHNSKCLCLCCTCMFVSIHHDKSPLTFTFHKSTFFNNFYFHFLVTVGYGLYERNIMMIMLMKMKGLASNGLGGDEKGIQHLIKFQFFIREYWKMFIP